MFCGNCGFKFDNDGGRCPICGALSVELSNESSLDDVISKPMREVKTNPKYKDDSTVIGNTNVSNKSIKKWIENNDSFYKPNCRYPVSIPASPFSRDNRSKIMVSLLVGIIVAMSFVVIVANTENNDYINEVDVNDPALLIVDNSLITFAGNEDNKFITKVGPQSDSVLYKLSQKISDKYGYFNWIIKNNNHSVLDCEKNYRNEIQSYSYYVGDSYPSSLPYFTWMNFEAGDYTIMIECFDDKTSFDKSQEPSATYEIYAYVDGNITRSYEWKFRGVDYQFNLTFDYGVFEKYNTDDITREYYAGNFGKTPAFVVVDDTIQTLANKLIELYKANFDESVRLGTQDFANFILSFVQINFDYPGFEVGFNKNNKTADFTLYGYDEYFAYPIETLYHSAGDCEDTSILCAALYKACGFKSALLIVPGHAMAGVEIDDFKDPAAVSGNTIVSGSKGGVTYYACETTTSTYLSAGLVLNKYSDAGNKSGNYGFFPVL